MHDIADVNTLPIRSRPHLPVKPEARLLYTSKHVQVVLKTTLSGQTNRQTERHVTQVCPTVVAGPTPLSVTCRSVDAALRRSIPAFNKDVKDVQTRMEAIAFQLRIPQRKPWQGMTDNVASSLALVQQRDKVLTYAMFD